MINPSGTAARRDSVACRGRSSSAALRDERILVTGGAGFIGGHAVAELLLHCDHVGVLDDFSSGSIENLAVAIDRGLAEQDVIVEDIREPAAARAVESWRPTILVHLAAQSKVAMSIVDPLADAAVNISGTVNTSPPRATRTFAGSSLPPAVARSMAWRAPTAVACQRGCVARRQVRTAWRSRSRRTTCGCSPGCTASPEPA